MKKYNVIVKEFYRYEGVEANNEEEAMDRIIALEGWGDCDNQFEIEASLEEE